MTHHIIPMHVLAELVVHSYPYKADIHMTLQVSLKRPVTGQCCAALGTVANSEQAGVDCAADWPCQCAAG